MGSNGRVQWDPERDLLQPDGRVPRKILKRRAVQIGVASSLSEFYVNAILSIEDVTELAHLVGEMHRMKNTRQRKLALETLLPRLPDERVYMPHCDENTLRRLGMIPGDASNVLAKLGRGKAIK